MEGKLVSLADIARMAGVSRAVVSNWKNRPNSDFPPERGGAPRRPLYDLTEVTIWLGNRGRTYQPDGGAASESAGRLWEVVNRLRGEFSPQDVVAGLLYSLACGEADREGHGEAFRASVAGLDDSIPALLDRMRAAEPDFIANFEATARTSDETAELAVTVATTPIAKSEHSTPRVVADLVTQLVGTSEVVFDPAIGSGSLASLVGRATGTNVIVAGQDLNLRAAAMAACTTQACGLISDIRVGDSLSVDPHPDLLADTVVFSPPFGMRLRDPADPDDVRWQYGDPGTVGDAAWIQTGLHHLAPGGTMVCLTQPGLLFRSGRERRILQGIVRANRLRAVVALPPRVLDSMSVAPVVLVFGSAPVTGTPTPSPILMVDVPTWIGEASSPSPLTSEVVTEVGAVVREWLDADRIDAGIPGVALATFDDIVANDWVLTPLRYQRRARRARVTAEELVERRRDTQAAHQTLSTTLVDLANRPLPAFELAANRRTLDKLKGVRVLPGITPRGSQSESVGSSDEDLPVIVSVQDLRSGEAPRPAANHTRGNQIEDLDILVTVGGHGIGSSYFCEPTAPENAFPSQMTAIIRVDADADVIPSYLAAWLSHPAFGQELELLAVGTGLRRVRLEDLLSVEIPLPDPPGQQKFADEGRRLRQLDRQLQDLAHSIESLRESEMSFIRDQVIGGESLC
jgi:type I restriction-modification system DNA methylase subunit